MSVFLDQAFTDRDADHTRLFYDEWSSLYDVDLAEQGYATPARCAAALAAFAPDRSVPVLDFGCGTGLSGEALKEVGFTTVDGVDISPAMLAVAEQKNIYRGLQQIPPGEKPEGGYALISAVGVIGLGAAPATTFDLLMQALPSGGKLVFSLNDLALADPGQMGRLNEWIDCSAAQILFAEYGLHLPGKSMKSTVYVMEKY
ncbi:class I SAM-dependent DNA methyltransferase [Sulfitobacter guttiformis]|uniref:Methyltransferase family protein n=1 Tax=Sulfitobacter guttiformis TaxID=74349 RepID=A0A420DI77_9RHOB|nr:methyltransferase domain-containing protein [Sulfitobacter guttiformis]KIN72291.1 Methyltransferase type 11 [Sulfitobacter guttiformis KCTC 32187]RKE93943.1 methyltransferase family protein [Sulfitobacter guttiformis]